MLAIRLKRMGKKKKPFYRVVVSDSRKTPKARFIESLGHYNPCTDPPEVTINREKALEWVRKGAQVSNTVQSLLNEPAEKQTSDDAAASDSQ
jgi:small subunit ribosomal protein S16